MIKEFLQDYSKKTSLKKTLYQLIHKNGPISKVALQPHFDVPPTTMARMIYELEERGYIESAGFGEAKGGRPPILYKAATNTGYLVGVEIARTHVKVMLVNIGFELVETKSFSLTNIHDPKRTIKLLVETIQTFQQVYEISDKLLLGIGIGAVGPLDRKRGIILNPEDFPAEGWENVSLFKELQTFFSCKMTLNNGANTAALAEYHFQPQISRQILYCINGYGVRCGYIHGGALLHDDAGDASSFGHIVIEPNGRLCTCGRRGCLTAYTSLRAISQAIAMKEQKQQGIKTPYLSFDQLIHDYQVDKQFVREAVMEAAYYYGLGLSTMINILNPNEVILHGKLIYQVEDYFQEVINVAKNHIYSNQEMKIRKGTFGEEAAPIGAAIQLFYDYF
ncbi:ROK family transcriptional regulator [Bacillus weihaiensis]|uniref:ROK family transcriptional regulator n=1 Tax=Bacillus weihaiensis TaxID=1547283 RepID=UPI0023560E6B|nr:ROK family transcriptional regulator [Bacillus weihaiensis]